MNLKINLKTKLLFNITYTIKDKRYIYVIEHKNKSYYLFHRGIELTQITIFILIIYNEYLLFCLFVSLCLDSLFRFIFTNYNPIDNR